MSSKADDIVTNTWERMPFRVTNVVSAYAAGPALRDD